MKFGYVIGRFNPVHLGHHSLIDYMIDNSDHHVIFIGSANKSRTDENPLHFEEREHILKFHYPDSRIIGLDDKEDINDWKIILNEHISDETRDLEIKEINIFSPIREDDHVLRADWIAPSHNLETFVPKHNISATQLRELWRNKDKFSHLVKKETGLFLAQIKL